LSKPFKKRQFRTTHFKHGIEALKKELSTADFTRILRDLPGFDMTNPLAKATVRSLPHQI